jgi:DNA-binding winged helix-turn-helix (wHTH) protein
MSSAVYAFGAFHLDPSRRMLFHGTQAIPLPERLAQLLLLLVQANGAIVEKEAIAAQVWPGTGMSDGNLSQHMYMLRQLLDERAKDRSYVLTIRGRGYRLAPAVSVRSPGASDGAVVDPHRTTSPNTLLRSGLEVFHRYSRGSYLVEKRTAQAMQDAIEHFEAALRLDPHYTPALVGLAQAYTRLALYWYVPGSYAFPKAKRVLLRALELDPSSACAHAVLSMILLFCDWDWEEAAREIAIAVRLNSNSTVVCNTAAWHYVCRGAIELAIAQTQCALAIEPGSLPLQLLLARMFLHAGDYTRAIELLSALIESGPEFAVARRYRAQAYIFSGQPAQALGDLLLLPPDRAEDVALRLPLLGRAYADCGDAERAEEIYATLHEMTRTEFIVHWNFAIVAIGLRRYDEALAHLERAFVKREPSLMFLRTMPWFEPIARRARFAAIRNEVYSRTGIG